MLKTEEATLGDLVSARPALAGLFERLGLDYCCGGGQTLAAACTERGLDAATVAVMLDAAGESEPASGAGHDIAGLSVAELCEHIVTNHHGPLRTSFVRTADRLATVVRVHGSDHPELHELESEFTGLRGEMEQHMMREELRLFPICRRLEQEPGTATLEPDMLDLLEDDHRETGAALVRIRELCSDYDTGRAFCGTHRVLLEDLRGIEADTHVHVHEENNILFPRVRELAAAGG